MLGGPDALVSLIMPAYEPRADWLLLAVRTALGQADCDLEVIVVDDGSPTPVHGLLGDIDDARLHVLRVPHGGASQARNAGVRAASGSFIRFVDADDAYERGSTARLLSLLDGREDAIAYGATLLCDPELRPLWRMESRLTGDVRVDCLLGRFTVRPPSMLFPRRVLDAAGPWDPGLVVSEDWDLVLRALDHATVVGERRTATYYRRHATSATSDVRAGDRGARLVVERYFERHLEERGTSVERRARAMLDARAARIELRHRRPLAALRRLATAAGTDPRAIADEIVNAVPAVRAAGLRRLRPPPQPLFRDAEQVADEHRQPDPDVLDEVDTD